MKRLLVLISFVCCASPLASAQSGYGGDGKTSGDSSVASYIRLYETAPGAATSALAGAGAGNVDNGAHSVKVTCYRSGGGETTGGTASNATTVSDKTTNGQISLTNIPLCSSSMTGRKVYMTTAGGSTYYLLSNGTIANITATTLTANDSDATLTASTVLPTSNTALDSRLTVGQDLVSANTAQFATGRYLGNNYIGMATIAGARYLSLYNTPVSSSNYSLGYTNPGTYLNTPTGEIIGLRVNNISSLQVTSSTATWAATIVQQWGSSGVASPDTGMKRFAAGVVKFGDGSTGAGAIAVGTDAAPCKISAGSGTPEGAVTGNVCDLFLRTDGSASTTLYVKTSGTGNTGWTAK